MKLFIIFLFLGVYALFAKELTPYKSIKVGDAMSDFVRADGKLIVATKESSLAIYDLASAALVEKITIAKQTSILGDEIGIIIASVDSFDGRIIFSTRHVDSWGDIYLYEQKKLTKLLDASQKIAPKEIKFANTNQIIINTMENELILFDIPKREFLYKTPLNEASFSDFVLSEDKKTLFTANEVPIVFKVEVQSGKILESYEEANKRDIFTIDYKSGILATGGKDKRLVLYKSPKSFTMTNADFFISSVALSPDATQVAFSKNEDDDIAVVETEKLKELYLLKKHTTKIVKIDFISNSELLTADEGGTLYFWKLDAK